MKINALYKDVSFSKRVELIALMNAHIRAVQFDKSEDYWRLYDAVLTLKEIEAIVSKEFGYL